MKLNIEHPLTSRVIVKTKPLALLTSSRNQRALAVIIIFFVSSSSTYSKYFYFSHSQTETAYSIRHLILNRMLTRPAFKKQSPHQLPHHCYPSASPLSLSLSLRPLPILRFSLHGSPPPAGSAPVAPCSCSRAGTPRGACTASTRSRRS